MAETSSRSGAFSCRSCHSSRFDHVLSLGALPLVNALVDPGTPGPDASFDIDVARCLDCTLVQLLETVAPERQFSTYTYFSSFSQTFVNHVRRFALDEIKELGLGPTSLVVEVGSNDGCLLQPFLEAGIAVLGIEPARNIAEAARERGIDTLTAFLDVDVAQRVVAERGPADLVVANNVIAHVPDIDGFVAALRVLAGEFGVVTIEFPYLVDLVDRVEFDTIYHEHVFYFSVTALAPILHRHGLTITRIEPLPVHGGSLRIHASAAARPGESVERSLASEQAWGVGQSARFERFASRVDRLKHDLHDLVAGLVDSGAVVAGYGAAAKGVVLANVSGLDQRLIRFVADRNPHKQGKLMPGVRIPIAPAERLALEQPDYCLIFAWNLTAEVLEQQADYGRNGGRFISPLPEPRVLNT